MSVTYHLSPYRRETIETELRLPKGVLSDVDLLNAVLGTTRKVITQCSWHTFLIMEHKEPSYYYDTHPVVIEGVDRTEHHH